MADELSVMLFWFADYSSFYSVLTIIVCFIVMVVFILRLNNENIFMNLNSTSVQQVNLAVERHVTDMVNPFSVKMRPNEFSSLKDGLHIELSVLKKCILQVYWGINLEEFHKAMQAPWQHILRHLKSKSWLEGYTMFCNDKKELNPCDMRHEHLQCPGKIDGAAIGEPPRKKYPAMVITYLPETLDDNSTDLKIVAVFSIIHLKDSICQQDSHILNQYLKTSNQQVFTLQPLFIATSPESQTRQTSQPVTQSNNTCKTPTSAGRHHSGGNEQKNETRNLDTVQQNDVLCSESEAGSSTDNVPDSIKWSKCGKTTDTCESSSVKFNCEATTCADSPVTSRFEVAEQQGSSVCQNPLLSEENDGGHINFQSDQEEECVVCQTDLVTFALLPCRHTCVCSACFTQLERCPMCRGYIESYFRVRHSSDEENLVTGEETAPDSLISTAHGNSVWERLNSRLNTFFGFS